MAPLQRRDFLRGTATLPVVSAFPFPPQTEWPGSQSMSVATWNLGLGTPLFDLLKTQAIDPEAVHSRLRDVEESDVPARMAAIANSLADEMPTAIGLQEVALVRTGPRGAGTDASDVRVDFLGAMLDGLREAGASYRVVATGTNADVALPATDDTGEKFDVRLTDRDVLLVRSDVPVRDTETDTFSLNVSAVVEGRQFTATRGFASADIEIEDVDITVATTHLAAASRAVRRAQAAELLSRLPERVVLAGDFNTEPGMGTYARLADDLTDVWPLVGAGEGYTCCRFPRLRHEPTSLEHRFDGVFVGRGVTPTAARRLGVSLKASVLWASDHTGVLAEMRVRPDLSDPNAVMRGLL